MFTSLRKRLIIIQFLCVSTITFISFGAKPERNVILERDYENLSNLPKVVIKNSSNRSIKYILNCSLTDTNEKKRVEKQHVFTLPPRGIIKVDPFGTLHRTVKKEVMLFTAELENQVNQQKDIASGVFGEAKPVTRKNNNLFGVNAELRCYPPHIQWKMLNMMKRAGITTFRDEIPFVDVKNKQRVKAVLNKLHEWFLAAEAYDMRPMILLGYFPKSFYNSPEKMKMAYEWTKLLAREFRGRADWHYGNETNSGWAAFGAAADMAALNRAFALGTESSDSFALKGSFGIAEGLTHYIDKFIQANTLPYLDAICIHPYCGTPEAGIAKCVAAKKLILAQSSNKQLWATEVGFQVDGGPGQFNQLTGELTGISGFSENNQKQFIARLFILAKAYHIDRIYWFNFLGNAKSRETFWIVDSDGFNPKGAYLTLCECSRRLKDVIPTGSTDFPETIQRHTFMRHDGSVMMACWSLKAGMAADFIVPDTVKIYDDQGREMKRPGDGILKLGHSVIYIEGLDKNKIHSLYNKDVIISTLDKRSFSGPMSRFMVKAGETFTVPYAVFNNNSNSVNICPQIVHSNPHWKIKMPERQNIAAKTNQNYEIKITVPKDAVPGCEYEFAFGANIDQLQMAYPYTIRVKIKDRFPYQDIVDHSRIVDYPIWDSMDESKVQCGRLELSAASGKAIIDGNLEEWRPNEFYPLDQQFQWKLRDPGIPDRNDWSGKVAFRWDDQYIYAAVLVKDDSLCFTDFLSRDWRDSDNFRIFLSSTSEKERNKKISDNDLLLIMTPTGVNHTEGPMLNAASLGGKIRKNIEERVKIASRIWKNGYLIEVAIPVKEFNLIPREGMTIGLNVMADDVDNGYRQHVSMTYYKNNSYWNSPRSLGRLKLKNSN